ncbi:MAG: hypothetical protein JJE04_07430 [Acidobacteriia bacterium]|nr:hypothetical protein [Terriglobia bacterium]
MLREGFGRVALLGRYGLTLILTAIAAFAVTEQQRIERLEMLADIWGKVYLFHPRIVTTRIDWPQVLIVTLPKVERAASTDELVAVLNESLFRPLDDPLTRAQRRMPIASDPIPNPRALAGRKLSATVGYIDATHPQMYGRDAAKQVGQVLQSLGPIEVVVVDLRFPVPPGRTSTGYVCLFPHSRSRARASAESITDGMNTTRLLCTARNGTWSPVRSYNRLPRGSRSESRRCSW